MRFPAFVPAFLIFLFGVSPLHASEDVLRGFLQELKQHGYATTLAGVSQNGESLEIGEMIITNDKAGTDEGEDSWELTFVDVTFENLSKTEGIGLKGQSFIASDVAYAVHEVKVSLGGFETINFDFPRFGELLDSLHDDTGNDVLKIIDPLGMMSGSFYQFLADASFDRLSFNKAGARHDADELQNVIVSSGPTILTALHDGTLERYQVGAIEMSVNVKGQEPVNIKVRNAEVAGYNFKSLARMLNEKYYIDGKGDGQWMAVSGLGIVEEITVSNNLFDFHIESMSLGNSRVRQTDVPPSKLFEDLAQLIKKGEAAESADVEPGFAADPIGEFKKVFPALSLFYQAIEYDGMEMKGLNVTPKAGTPFSIDSMGVSGFSLEKGIPQVSVKGLDVTNPLGDRARLGNFSINNIQFPELDGIMTYLDLVAQNGSPKSPNYQAFAVFSPTIGGIKIDALTIDRSAGEKLGVEGFHLKMDDYIKLTPTKISLNLDDLKFPVSLIPQAQPAGQMLAGLGYEDINLNGQIDMIWDEATGNLEILPSKVTAGDMGEIRLAAKVSGVPRALFENPEKALLFMSALIFEDLSISFEDASFVNRFIDHTAKQSGIDAANIRSQFAAFASGPLAFLQNPDFAQKVSGAVGRFLENPGTLTISAKPSNPVPVVGLVLLFQQSPDQIVEALGLDVSAQ